VRKESDGRGLRGAALFAVLAVGMAAAVLGGCACEGPRPRDLARAERAPFIRVKLGSDTASLGVAVDGPYRLADRSGKIASGDRLEWTRFDLREGVLAAGGRALGPGTVELHPERDGTLCVRQRVGGGVRERSYRGFLRIAPTPEGAVRAINIVRMEAYLAGVLANELPRTWHPEAYAAQAVAARTYALDHRNRRVARDFDIYDSERSQVYGGFDTETDKTWEAVAATCGVVATYRDEAGRLHLLTTYYHSTCGGATAPVGEVFGGRTPPPLAGVKCPYCFRSRRYRWSGKEIFKKEVGEALRRSGLEALRRLGEVQGVEIAARASDGRATKIRVTDAGEYSVALRADLWRNLVGGRKAPSTWFTIRDAGDRIVLEEGHGLGHGVGMCQYGAEYLAEHGKTAEEILRYYYPGVQLVRAY